MKICPILKAGTMVKNISASKGVKPGIISTHSDELRHESPECMGNKCEWYGAGCPAHSKIYWLWGTYSPRKGVNNV